MDANFQACLRHVFAMEGEFSNDPSDHGGATNWGIAAATLAHWRGHPVTEADAEKKPRQPWQALMFSPTHDREKRLAYCDAIMLTCSGASS